MVIENALDIVVTEAGWDDFDAIVGLNRTYYPARHYLLDRNYLEWLYLLNPAGKARLVFAKESGVLIGMLALIPIDMLIGKQQLKACYCVNVLSHPEHRNKHIFNKLIRKTREVLQQDRTILLGHPNRNARPGWRRQKMTFREPLRPFLGGSVDPLAWWRTTRIRTGDELRGLSFEQLNQGNDEGAVRVVNSPEFVKWRYLDCPNKRYKVFITHHRGRIDGLAVTVKYRRLVNLLVHYGSSSAGREARLPRSFTPYLVMSQRRLKVAGTDALMRLPIDKSIAFFLEDWERFGRLDTGGLSLACSDF